MLKSSRWQYSPAVAALYTMSFSLWEKFAASDGPPAAALEFAGRYLTENKAAERGEEQFCEEDRWREQR